MNEVKFCVDCHCFLGTRNTLGKQRFNSLKRCPECQSIHRKLQKANYQMEYRGDARTVRRKQKKEEPNMNAYARLTALENAIKSRILLYSEQLFADMTDDSMFLNELYYLLGKREELFQELGCSYNQTKEEQK